jgi:hypothetical protein
MPRKKAASRENRQLCHISIDENNDTLASMALGESNPQRDFPAAIKKARIYQRQWFISAILKLRLAYFNYGFRLEPIDKKADKEDFKAWWEEQREAATQYAREVWMEWLPLDNAVSFWQPDSGLGRPILLHLDQCRYTDFFGTQQLFYRHGLGTEQIKALNISEDLKAKFRGNPEVEIPPDQFKVLKRSKLGSGFAWPGLMDVAKALAQSESMEVGDNILAYVGRKVWELHKMGHEIKAGPHAGYNTHFWKRERALAFERAVKGKLGHIMMTVNFDHAVEFPYPDQTHFKGEKYQAVIDRLVWWANPFGHMILARTLTPYLMDLLRTLAEGEREMVGPYLQHCINASFDVPEDFGGLRVVWSKRIFRDARMATDLLKVAFSAGAASQSTMQEEIGLDPVEERARKEEEARLPKDQTMPLYDPNHGPPEGANGRPPGSGDKK